MYNILMLHVDDLIILDNDYVSIVVDGNYLI